jgi:hypothetical protein
MTQIEKVVVCAAVASRDLENLYQVSPGNDRGSIGTDNSQIK